MSWTNLVGSAGRTRRTAVVPVNPVPATVALNPAEKLETEGVHVVTVCPRDSVTHRRKQTRNRTRVMGLDLDRYIAQTHSHAKASK